MTRRRDSNSTADPLPYLRGGHRLNSRGETPELFINDDERSRSALIFALACFASPFVIVGFVALGYMKFAPLLGLPA